MIPDPISNLTMSSFTHKNVLLLQHRHMLSSLGVYTTQCSSLWYRKI